MKDDAPSTPPHTKYKIGNLDITNYKDSADSNRDVYNTELCDGGSGETDQTSQAYQGIYQYNQLSIYWSN
jgi:hypothetical protein